MLTKERLADKPFAPALPHVVILGAGASKAAFPKGDRNKRAIPLMDELPNVIGSHWNDLIQSANPPVEVFEAQFSWIRREGRHTDELANVEKVITGYFETLELPDEPTIYDYLVLGLRSKDVIATFNWDPFLMLAHKRNRVIGDLPDIRFLHGCVRYATCIEHDVLGCPSEMCPKCHQELARGPLFFPDDDKDYAKDALVQRDWKIVAEKFKKAFHLTIFGYSGPATDYNARRLLLEGWKQTPLRSVSHVEIIDIKDESLLRQCWSDFVAFQHDMVTESFWESTIARWPRRTAEYKISASLYGMPSEYLGPLRSNSLNELQEWHSKLAAAEAPIDRFESGFH